MLAALFQRRVQFEAVVEVVLHRALAAAGDDDDVLDPRRDRLFHAVLDDGLVHQRQHLFGNHLGGRQKARAQSRLREILPSNSFAHSLVSFLHLKIGQLSGCDSESLPRSDTRHSSGCNPLDR
jgi:hypothetical protein